MSTLIDLPNVGRVLAGNLAQAGIHTPEELRRVGSREAFLRVRAIDPGACLHMLYGMEGAVQGVRDTLLSERTKAELKAFFAAL